MRALTDREALTRFMRAFGTATTAETRVYFTGGVTAVLLGWRASTIDVDLQVVPDRDELFRAIATLKDQLRINVELAAPSHFIPELPGWESRVRPARLLELFEAIENQLHRYPAITPSSFRASVIETLQGR